MEKSKKPSNPVVYVYVTYYSGNVFVVLVLILSVRGVLVRKFMLAAYSLGMTRGDWTFLDVEIFQVENTHDFLYKPDLKG
jgi:hypothetical protein